MKLRKTLLLGVLALALPACSSEYGTKISQKDFIEAASSFEQATFTKATASFTYSKKYSPKILKDINQSGLVTFTDYGDGFELDAGQDTSSLPFEISQENLFKSFVGYNAKNLAAALAKTDLDSDASLTFYKNPIGVKAVLPADVTDNLYSGYYSTQVTEYYSFDKYGYAAKVISDQKVYTAKYDSETGKVIDEWTETLKIIMTIEYK